MSSYTPDYRSGAEPPDERENVQLRMGSVTMWLIVINVIVFLLEAYSGFGRQLLQFGSFYVGAALVHAQIWRFITFQFLHANINHIVFNMLALYVFGPLIEDYLGSRRYLLFYLLSGVGGALLYVVLWALGILHETPYSYMVGASAGIFGVLIAAASVAPDATVMLLFPPIPLKLKTLAWIMVAIAVATVIFHLGNAGGEAAHLGGAAVGALLIRSSTFLSLFGARSARR